MEIAELFQISPKKQIMEVQDISTAEKLRMDQLVKEISYRNSICKILSDYKSIVKGEKNQFAFSLKLLISWLELSYEQFTMKIGV